ncbi:SusD/RagB family nutrient-binding outer membrane lipoprotein [Chitinophaga parva]|uniref:SusD/RagB family nutrient-binding outer membrane lipoprotein n=1 Tax=Chitinophaga parva TaxID=2169414 RepID=A0A2T7BLZ2_9BACT|nr:SusD/RagB family nutrient-binding outer membrane lipoprotein [Chitinophaga parva]PUZ28698.1 SusD/RagB family nutrient-binding outer membrane lipoprotein [Chitinophaga parva]
MKKILSATLLLAALVVAMSSCKKSFSDLGENNNKPVKVAPSLLFTGILNDTYEAPYTMAERWGQYYLCNYDYYGNNRYDFGGLSAKVSDVPADYYSTLANVLDMEKAAMANGANATNPYEALGKFFRAYLFTKMSLEVGDLPMTDALQGLNGKQPKYDTQKAIFKQAFIWLDSANTELAKLIANPDQSNTTPGQVLKGDIFLANNLVKWQKVVNTLRIRLLLELSLKATDADLNVPAQFAMILSNPAKYPLMSDATDNLQYTYINPTNKYPNNPDNFGFDALRYNTSNTYIHLLDSLQDPRVYITAEPARYLVDTLKQSATDFKSFVGADPGQALKDMYARNNHGEYSLLNRHHYYDTYTAEPSIQIGFPELMFNIAEGINRGWYTGAPADSFYKAGIRASMDFYGIPVSGPLTVFFLHPGASLGNYDKYNVTVDFNTYYNQATVKYAAGAQGLKQILQQRYLALFRHSGLESYFTYRRTGVPNFTVGDGTGNSNRIPLRFQYNTTERSANTDNYEAALQSQYGGNDDINGVMWLLSSK